MDFKIDFDPENLLYYYRVEITRVVDGDTFFGIIDLGLGLKWSGLKYGKKKRSSYQAFRFNRINCLETSLRQGQTKEQKKKGLEAKAFVEKYLKEGTEVIVQTKKAGGLKRPLVEVYYNHELHGWIRLNDFIVFSEHGEYKIY